MLLVFVFVLEKKLSGEGCRYWILTALVVASYATSVHPLTPALQLLHTNRDGTKAAMHELCNTLQY